MNTPRQKILSIALLLVSAVIIALLAYLSIEHNYFQKIISFIDKDMPPVLFVVSMIILPVTGFPVTVFLIMGGIKFGIINGLLLWFLTLPIHALIGFYLARLLRKPLRMLSEMMGYSVPQLPEKKTAWFSFLFLAIPGIPYAGKNYLLALAGAPFRYCVFMNIIVQFPQGAPFVILGRSAMELDMRLFYLALAFIIIIYIILRWLKKKYEDKVDVS
ncbi:TVP38/TMEM64 family protein [Desulfonatronovibrio magnus]|uniref:TVP38/TMEM64 family protein n=1 Tax=Desulfonatronovibrio magnus TaxID=698827 RepID=UPI0012FCB3F6|nr:VTT domain-containing protein [Desulfonatronovibrio magnus]